MVSRSILKHFQANADARKISLTGNTEKRSSAIGKSNVESQTFGASNAVTILRN
jgi:hypothetical protein